MHRAVAMTSAATEGRVDMAMILVGGLSGDEPRGDAPSQGRGGTQPCVTRDAGAAGEQIAGDGGECNPPVVAEGLSRQQGHGCKPRESDRHCAAHSLQRIRRTAVRVGSRPSQHKDNSCQTGRVFLGAGSLPVQPR
jgi:hypothetical protein